MSGSCEYSVVLNQSLEVTKNPYKIVYQGNNLNLAKEIFDELQPGYDEFGDLNKRYLVILYSLQEGFKPTVLRYKIKRL